MSRLHLPRCLNKHDYDTTLITDEPLLASVADSQAFAHATLLPKASESSEVTERVDDVSETQLAQFFAAVADTVLAEGADDREGKESQAHPRLVWAHTRGMYGAWDAPIELQESLHG